jgi:hypothetical protein
LTRIAGTVRTMLLDDSSRNARAVEATFSQGLPKLRVLCIGTGRDGTQSVTHMLQHVLQRRGGGEAIHEYRCRDLYHAFCELRETGRPEYERALRGIAAECPHEAIVGNGYAAILPLFAQAHGRRIKLVHLRRADRAACIASLVHNCELFPSAYGYYSSSPHATVKRMAAFHFGDMSHSEWDRLPIQEKFGWYYDKTHALVDGFKGLFDETVEIETEALDDEATRQTLARFVCGLDSEPPPKTHLNAASINIASFPEPYRHKMHWLMGRLNVAQVAEDEVYALDYFLEKFIAWTGYQITQAPQLGTAVAAPADRIAGDLERAILTVQERLRELQSLRDLLRENKQGADPRRLRRPSI